jgi:hypothetical protein
MMTVTMLILKEQLPSRMSWLLMRLTLLLTNSSDLSTLRMMKFLFNVGESVKYSNTILV